MATFRFNHRAAVVILSLAFCAVFGDSAVRAGSISSVIDYRNNSYQQVGNGNDLTVNGSFFSADLFSNNPGDYSSVTLTYPGVGSPQALTATSPTNFHFQTALLPSQAAMDAAYPAGAYQFSASNGGPADVATVTYASDDYPQSLPYLTGTTYSDLQGMNAANPFTFNFSADVTGGSANSSFMFLTIYDYTKGLFVFNDGFLPPSTSSVVVSGNTLTPGDSFSYELDFSNRDLVAANGTSFPNELGFDVRTAGAFSSAPSAVTPLPTSAAGGLFLLAGAGLFGILRTKRNALA